jgi:hypothetical protein
MMIRCGARAELSAALNNGKITSKVAIGACGEVKFGFFAKSICNPCDWLPVTVLNGPTYDFSRFCA